MRVPIKTHKTHLNPILALAFVCHDHVYAFFFSVVIRGFYIAMKWLVLSVENRHERIWAVVTLLPR
jgi:hypothetical protein